MSSVTLHCSLGVDLGNCFHGSPREDKDQIHNSAPEIRDVFGDFDDDEEEDGYAVHHDIEHDSNRSPVEEEGYEKGLRPEDILADEDHRYGLEEENYEMKTKEKPLGLPLELEVPLQPPPALPEKTLTKSVSPAACFKATDESHRTSSATAVVATRSNHHLFKRLCCRLIHLKIGGTSQEEISLGFMLLCLFLILRNKLGGNFYGGPVLSLSPSIMWRVSLFSSNFL
ncbi:hypothetical protein HN51_015687 [Arachis hypogaea]